MARLWPADNLKMVRTGVDNDLVERCINGDQAAWKELLARYQRLVYSVAYGLCPPGEDVSDVFQQVWLDVYQSLPQLRNAAAFPAWLITVTKRRVYAVVRSGRAWEPIDDDEIPDVAEHTTDIEREHTIERALDQLPERCRKLIKLLYLDSQEPSYAEIGDTMGMPVASIGPTRARCLEKLRKLIG
jgi:RNA polymerase sigma factor (sigma-70 family)